MDRISYPPAGRDKRSELPRRFSNGKNNPNPSSLKRREGTKPHAAAEAISLGFKRFKKEKKHHLASEAPKGGKWLASQQGENKRFGNSKGRLIMERNKQPILPPSPWKDKRGRTKPTPPAGRNRLGMQTAFEMENPEQKY